MNTAVNKRAFMDSLERKARKEELTGVQAATPTRPRGRETGGGSSPTLSGEGRSGGHPEKESMTPKLGLELASWRQEGRA